MHRALEEILSLDPVADHYRIVFLDQCIEFPWDSTRACELALYRTFAIPSIARLLDQTGEFRTRAQKRYDDTLLILSEILDHGYDSERGRAAIRRMNQIHGRFEISNDDFLYVLSTFIFEPIRWISKYGYRPMAPPECIALYKYWRAIGTRMNITHIPEDLASFESFNVSYEAEHFAYSPETERTATATREMFLGWLVPRALYSAGAPAVHALMDPPLRAACGFPPPPPGLQPLIGSALRLRGRVAGLLPERRRALLRTQVKMRSYLQGYDLEQLGPN